jgi:hypothetical protein
MGRTHDVTISAFDLDRLEAQLDAVTEQRDRLERELAAERALADQLGIALNRAMEIIPDPDELSYTERIKTLRWEKLIAAWKEARSE